MGADLDGGLKVKGRQRDVLEVEPPDGPGEGPGGQKESLRQSTVRPQTELLCGRLPFYSHFDFFPLINLIFLLWKSQNFSC